MRNIDPALELEQRLWAWMDEQEELIQAIREEPTTDAIAVDARWYFGQPETRSVGMRREQGAK